MLTQREYEPAAQDLLYHYCSAEAFLAICNSKKLRFSDLFSVNDFLEMHWGYNVWKEAANDLLETVGREFLDNIDKILHGSGLLGVPVASCFSLDGDVLSQWRAYADDGNGYAIGFRPSEITRIPVRALRVLYDKDQQISEVKKIIKAIYDVESKEPDKGTSGFREVCLFLAFDLAALKNPTFVEEQEVRLIHLLNFEESNSSLRLIDSGGTAFGVKATGQTVSFRMRNGVPAAYIDIDFTNNGKVNPIREVVVGPKNGARLSGVSVFLETMGIPSVDVRRSRASYR